MQHQAPLRSGNIVKAENLGIENFEITDILQKHYNYKNVILNNDAKCAALCEKEFGSLKQYEDAVFLCLGTGIGGAVFLNRKTTKT
ncbi:MAG: ROK family protein [Clostridia bacterium]|nr:ROK family protein [Clostridia bacterium]